MNRVWRSTAIRTIAGYRTTSLDAASLIARMPPLHLAANARARTYLKIAELRKQNEVSRQAIIAIRIEVEEQLREEWRTHLRRRDVSGKRTVEAILPHFDEWLKRSHGDVNFRWERPV